MALRARLAWWCCRRENGYAHAFSTPAVSYSPSVNEKAFAPGGAGSVWADDFRGEGGQLDVKSLRGLEQRLVRFDHDEGGESPDIPGRFTRA